MILQYHLLPFSGPILHLLWKSYFLKQYLKQDAGCEAACGACGAVNLKIFRKHAHQFIIGIANLKLHV